MANVAGPFSLIQPFFGEPPEERMKKYLDQQAAANAGAVAGDPAAPFSGAYQAPPTGGPPPMGVAKPGPQEPQAHQTPQSWGSMLMDLQRQNEAGQGFNQAVGMGLSAFSQPRSREAVSKMFNQQTPDAFKMGESLMAMNSQQQGQDRANMIARMVNDPNTGPALAQKLNMPWETLKAGIITDPGLVAKVTEAAAAPTPTMADVQQATTWMQSQGWDPKKIKDTQELIMTGVVKSEDLKQMELDRQAYKTKHGVDPPWAGDPSGWKQSVQNTAQLNESVNAARDTHGKNIGAVTDMNNRVEAIKKSPALDGLLKSSGLKKQAAKSLLLTDPLTPINTLIQSLPAGVSFTPEERGVIDNIRQLKGQEYGTALQRLSMSRPAASEITGIQQGLGQIQNFDLDPATYREQALDQMDDMLKTVRANSYGASQNFNDMPEDLRPYADPQYTKGGTRNLEGSGSEGWADKVKATPEEEAQAQQMLKPASEGGGGKTRDQVARWFRSHGVHLKGF